MPSRPSVAAKGVSARMTAPSFHYGTSQVRMVNNGHTVQLNYDVGSTLRLSNQEYKLAQFHFHTPSEHTKNGEHYPLDVHLVHTGAAGTPKVVVGVLIEEGLVNAALFTAFRHLPRHEGETSTPVGALINASALLPFNRAFFHDAGSLATPPLQRGAPVVRDEEPHPAVRLADCRLRAAAPPQPEQPPRAAVEWPQRGGPVRSLIRIRGAHGLKGASNTSSLQRWRTEQLLETDEV
ncbi:carbonic anhydrase family protein [Myxococcus xanthus]|uniref:carbonic anhydrase family protein n=1 Tax=Myxococcus xanthus TaxID=34 RepID=UPI003F51A9FC